MPQGQEAWCRLIKNGGGDLHVQVDALVAVSPDWMMEVVTLHGRGVSTAVDLLLDRLGSKNVHVLERSENRAQVSLKTPVCPVVQLMNGTGLVPRFPMDVEHGWDRLVVVDQKEALKNALEVIREEGSTSTNGERPKVLRSGPVRPPHALLTPHQRRVLETAYGSGYYQTPRGTTIRALAETLGVSKSSLSETLMAIERKLMHRYLIEQNGDQEGNGAQAPA